MIYRECLRSAGKPSRIRALAALHRLRIHPPAAFICLHSVERIGALETQRPCVVHSIGVNHESSFERGLLTRTAHCQVWGYDCSVERFGPLTSELRLGSLCLEGKR